MVLLGFVLMLAAGPPQLSLEVSSPQTRVLVGEPVKLTLTWRASVSLRLDPIDQKNTGRLEVITNDGTTERVYREHARRLFEDQFPLPKRGERGPILTKIVLIDGDYGLGASEFLFPQPGAYTLAAAGVEAGKTIARSNSLSFTVEEPRGEDLQVCREASRRPL